MMYVSYAPNGYAMVSTIPPEDGFYVEVEELPAGDGILCISSDGTLFRIPAPEPEPEPQEPDEPEDVPSVWDELDAAYQEGVDSV